MYNDKIFSEWFEFVKRDFRYTYELGVAEEDMISAIECAEKN